MRPDSITIQSGQSFAVPIQCYVRGSGTVSAVFNSSDLLTAAFVQSRQTVPIFAPTIEWYTANNSQTGYGEGQVEVSVTNVQAVLLVPTVSYTLIVWRALVADSSATEEIVRLPIVVEAISYP